MPRKVITISREFGSGGRTIGRAVAEVMGVPFYDGALIEKVANATGFDEGFVEEKGEQAGSKNRFAYAFLPRDAGGLSAEDHLWLAQCETVAALAEKGPCVIVGRSADYVLREREDQLNVFIHASPELRAERIVRLYGETPEDPLKRLTDKDERRKRHYKHYTGQEWGMSQNYHLSLDSGVIGIERCTELIVAVAQRIDHFL